MRWCGRTLVEVPAAADPAESRAGVRLTNLDAPLFPGAGVPKRALVDYLDAVSDALLPELQGRPLSVVRVVRDDEPFMQKNLPKGTPEWVPRVEVWAEASQRTVTYGLCEDRRTLLWFANQRAVEFHVPLVRAGAWDRPTHLVIDLDPPSAAAFGAAVHAALVVRAALDELGLRGAVKTSGAKGVHVVVPVEGVHVDDAAAATRALAARAERLDPAALTTAFLKADRGGRVFVDATRAGGGTVVAAFSPRARPGVPVSLPVAWADVSTVVPADCTITTVPALLRARHDPWNGELVAPQRVPADLVAEGREIPVPRVAAMHEGRRRARAARGRGDRS